MNDENELKEVIHFEHDKDGYTININIYNNINIANEGSYAGSIEQRAEGGGQINKNVGTNANQGGQNAINGSQSANNESQFANGNGRSGIAGKGNDEQGGQEAIKIRKKGGCDCNSSKVGATRCAAQARATGVDVNANICPGCVLENSSLVLFGGAFTATSFDHVTYTPVTNQLQVAGMGILGGRPPGNYIVTFSPSVNIINLLFVSAGQRISRNFKVPSTVIPCSGTSSPDSIENL